MTTDRNALRADNARAALLAYVAHKGEQYEDEPTESNLTDLLTDILHLALQEDLGVAALISRAIEHFNAEQVED